MNILNLKGCQFVYILPQNSIWEGQIVPHFNWLPKSILSVAEAALTSFQYFYGNRTIKESTVYWRDILFPKTFFLWGDILSMTDANIPQV